MPDIRQSTRVRDDFQRPDENPIENTPEHPWLFHIWSSNYTRLAGHTLLSAMGGPTGFSYAYWNANPQSDADGGVPEMWARAWVSFTFPFGTRMGLGSPDGYGYAYLQTEGFGQLLRRQEGGIVRTDITTLIDGGDGVYTTSGHLQLMRLTSSHVEIWRSDDPDGDDWTLTASAPDTTYRDNMYAILGTTGDEDSWTDLGYGPGPEWHPEFMRRPWEYQGKALDLT